MLWLLCCLPVLTGCIGEEDYANDPVGNFEQLWKIIDEQYCFLEAKGIDWDAVHDKYSPLIIPTMSNDDLFDILSQMLYILKDGHVNLSSAKRTSFYDEWYQGYDWNYREDILYQTYLGSASTGYYTSAGLKYKIFDNNIGYIRYESFSSGVGDGNLDEVLLYLATCNGLIIDVRDNGGGNLTNSTRIAARFTNEKTLTGYIQHKTGPGHNDFSKMEPIYLEPSNSIRWQKKVIILTNRRCYSATNDFVNAIIDDYFNSFEIRKYYINKYEQPYYGVLSYLYDIGYTFEYELLQEAHLQDSFDSATGSVDVKKFAEDGVVHVYSNETGKDVAQIPLTKLSELEKEVKDFVEYKLSTYKVTNPTKRSDLVPKSIYAFDIPDEIARVKRYKEYAEYCLKQLEQMQKEG